MDPVHTIDLVVALSDRCRRKDAADALAAHLGVEALLLFVRDPALGALLPAPGLAQTVRGGRSWRAFIASFRTADRYEGEVEIPPGLFRGAVALLEGDTAVVLLGGAPRESAITELKRVLPLLSAMLAAEQRSMLAVAEAGAAADAASRAEALAAALEAARADASALNAELRDEHRRKDEFLAMLGHELRNPLAPIVTSIQLLRLRKPEQPLPAGLVDIMARQTTQLTRLIDDLLDVSRVSRGQIELKREPVLLADVLTDAIEETRGLFINGAHEMTVSGLDESVVVNGDRVRLTQVFGNLLANAAKYTDRAGRVAVSISRDRQNAIVRVQDNGIGITSAMLPRIFDLFTQAPVALARAQGGLGIGLTLVRTLVELHGGRVTAASGGLGQGSTFSVSLPLETVTSAVQPKPLVAKPVSDRSLRVLVVDDNRDAADCIAVLLRAMGHHVDVCYDGAAAIALAPGCDADLILLDIGLPGIDGYEVARRLRPAAKAGARIVALTGYGSEEGKRLSREAGFDTHVVKPVTSESLAALMVSAGSAESSSTMAR